MAENPNANVNIIHHIVEYDYKNNIEEMGALVAQSLCGLTVITALEVMIK